jgi:hypothetical protein
MDRVFVHGGRRRLSSGRFNLPNIDSSRQETTAMRGQRADQHPDIARTRCAFTSQSRRRAGERVRKSALWLPLNATTHRIRLTLVAGSRIVLSKKYDDASITVDAYQPAGKCANTQFTTALNFRFPLSTLPPFHGLFLTLRKKEEASLTHSQGGS